jgi:hypothetical protein
MTVTRESKLLERHPSVREHVLANPEFARWRDSLPTVLVDGELFTVFGGDRLIDVDQLIVEWVLENDPSLLDQKEK